MRYASIIGSGRATLIEDLNEKRVALASLMAHYAPNQPWQFPLPALQKTCVFSVAVKNLSFKKRIVLFKTFAVDYVCHSVSIDLFRPYIHEKAYAAHF